MKKWLTLCFAVLFLFNISFASYAAEAEIPRATTAPTIDGEIDDMWNDVDAHKLTNYIVAEKDNADLDPVKDEDDFSGQWRAMWDDENIYVLVEITDPTRIGYNFERDGGNQQRDDSVMIMVGEGESHINTYYHADTKSVFGAWTNAPEWETFDHDEIIEAGISDHGDGYIVEAAIPWEYAGINGVEPAVDKTVNFEVHAVDNDLGPEMNEIGVEGRYPQSKLTWNDTENKAHESSEFLGQLRLVETADTGGTGNDADDADDNDANEDTNDNDNNTPATPDMPQTGQGGTSAGTTAIWIVVALAVLAIALVAARRMSAKR